MAADIDIVERLNAIVTCGCDADESAQTGREAADTITALHDENTALRSRIEELERERDEAREKAFEEAARIADEMAVEPDEDEELGGDDWWERVTHNRAANSIASRVRALGKERT